ncbi:MAG TPA: hypothetical protein VG944_14245 [Fimbriimonas sp.]|nr:hypothetical protein [Fimbriimonas sp.]
MSRYLPTGMLDPSIGGGKGYVEYTYGPETTGLAVAAQRDGKAVVAGGSGPGFFTVGRYTPEGAPDSSFGQEGRAKTHGGKYAYARGVAVTQKGRILVAGYAVDSFHHWKATLLAYRSNGSLDERFGKSGIVDFTTNGRVMIRFAALTVLPDRHILALGDVAGRIFLVRLNQAGKPDPHFGKKGVIYYDVDGDPLCYCAEATGLAVDRRGRLVASASATGSAVVMRLFANGRRDPSFGNHGVVRRTLGTGLGAEDVAVQRNGKIAVAGYYNVPGGEARVAALRFLPDGRPDLQFGRRGVFTRDFGWEGVANAALALRNGDLIIAGRTNRDRPETREIYDSAEPFLARFLP